MLFLFDKIMRIVYGQEEIDIGIQSEGNTDMQNSEGSEPSVGLIASISNYENYDILMLRVLFTISITDSIYSIYTSIY